MGLERRARLGMLQRRDNGRVPRISGNNNLRFASVEDVGNCIVAGYSTPETMAQFGERMVYERVGCER
jgi:hypothetical protein